MQLKTRTDASGQKASALFSDDDVYRYELLWRWSEAPLLLAWMLNPSTADHLALDRTISGLKARAMARGLGGVQVINLFAFRATHPKDMKANPDPVGPENDAVIRRVLSEANANGDKVICAWGNHGLHRDRQGVVLATADELGVDLYKYKLTAKQCPGHPLRLSHALEPTLWRAASGPT